MFISMSKIQFESKSQQKVISVLNRRWCLSVCQRYNLKANHNSWKQIQLRVLGVYQYVKDTIWKQITTIPISFPEMNKVFISMSKIQFESKSQHFSMIGLLVTRCLSVCQRYNLKANHNNGAPCPGSREVFISMSKIQFESKSQRNIIDNHSWSWCLSVCQRYNLKANHNMLSL